MKTLVSRLKNCTFHSVDDFQTELGLTKSPSSMSRFLGIEIVGKTELDLRIFQYQEHLQGIRSHV